MKRVFHYTTKENLELILASKKLIASKPWGPSDDSTYGAGWYFTYKRPESSDEEIARLWLKSQLDPEDAEAYLEFEIHESILVSYEHKGRGDVFKLDYDLVVGEHLDITQPYARGSEIVIKFVRHGYREKENAADSRLEKLQRAATMMESQSHGLDSKGKLSNTSSAVKIPQNQYYYDPSKDI